MIKELSCPNHENFQIHFINVMKEDKQRLQCCQCVSEQKEYQNILSIQKIKMAQESTLYETWPPLSNESIRDKIKDLQNIKTDFSEQINDYFDQLSKEINETLQQTKKKILIEAEIVTNFRNHILQYYYNFQSTKELKEFLMDDTQLDELEEKLKKLINQKYESSQENCQTILNMIKYYEEINIFDNQQRNLEKEKLKDQIQSIKFFYPNKLSIENTYEQLNEMFSNLDNYKIIQKDLYDRIFESDRNIQDLLSQLNLKFNFSLQGNKNAQRLQIKQDQISLSFENSPNKKEYDLLIKLIPIFLDLHNTNGSYNGYVNFFKLINQTLNNNNIQLSLQDKRIILSKINYSQDYISITWNEQNQSCIILKKGGCNYTQAYLNQILNPQFKYIIRVKVVIIENVKYYFGLIKNGKEDTEYIDSQNLGIIYPNQHSRNSAVNQQELQNEAIYNELEFRVHIKQKQLQVTDYPIQKNVKNIYPLQTYYINQIEQNGDYYFGLEFFNGTINSQIIVTHFEQLNEFPNN